MAETEEEPGIEVRIGHAVRSRLQHFKNQADSLTLESVRRLLEKDLGLEKFALDAHKRFIRQYLEKQMDDADNCDSKTASDVDKDNHLSDKEDAILPKQPETKKESTKSTPDDKEMMEDSPILGVLSPKSEAGAQTSSLNESTIKKAIWERADHFLANSETITLVGVRRLLEEDLGLDKNALDSFKKYISQQIDQVLNPPQGAKTAKDVKIISKSSQSKKSGKISREEGSDSLGDESDGMEDKVKSRKEAVHRKNKKLEEVKKRKRSTEGDFDVSSKKQNKLAKGHKEEDSESDDAENVSEDGQSKLSVEKSRNEKTIGYGRKVEHLKSVIKACGMSVAPSIYKKAKQVSDEKREAFIVKELERILLREGLSRDPSEKEIKDCRKRKETAKELEGIDMSNIISSTRRRSTFSFVPPKFETRVKGDKVGTKDVKNKEKTKKDQNDDNEEGTENKKEQEDVEKKAEDEQTFEEEEDEEEDEDEDVEDDDEEEAEEDEESEGFNEDNNEESD